MYKIQRSDIHSIDDYPNVSHEPMKHKTETVMSFFKDRVINSRLLRNDNEVARRITSGFLITLHIKDLFDACRHSPTFISDFEEYITIQLFSKKPAPILNPLL